MRRLLLVLVATIVAGLGTAGTASAHAPCTEAGMPGNSKYGRLHIATHGPHGHGVEGHNPGTHRGFSLCNPHSEHFGEPKP